MQTTLLNLAVMQPRCGNCERTLTQVNALWRNDLGPLLCDDCHGSDKDERR